MTIPHQSETEHPSIIALSVSRYVVGKLAKVKDDDTEEVKAEKRQRWAAFTKSFKNAIMTVDELVENIKCGWSISAELTNGYRNQSNFKSSQLLGLDFDTEDHQSTVAALSKNPFIMENALLIHTTSSHTDERPRARVLFKLPEPITDPKKFIEYQKSLLRKYKLSDQQVSDPARLWFGAKDCTVEIIGKTLDLGSLEHSEGTKSETPSGSDWSPFGQPIPEGTRNNHAYHYALKFLKSGLGLTEEQVLDLLVKNWQALGYMVPVEELRDAVKNAAKRVAEKDSKADKQPKLVLRSSAEAMKPQPPVDWLVDNVFSMASTNVVYGDPGSKKTYSMIYLAACVAAGVPFLDHEVRQGPVLFIDEESGNIRMLRRLHEVFTGLNVKGEVPLTYTTVSGLSLSSPDDVNELDLAVRQTGASLVIIDALVDVLAGDENTAKDTAPVFKPLRVIAEQTGACVIVIHHSNKGGTIRGSIAIPGFVDCVFKVESKTKEPYCKFIVEKTRDTEPVDFAANAVWDQETEAFYFDKTEVKVDNGKHGKPEDLSKVEMWLFLYVRDHSGTSTTDVAEAAEAANVTTKQVARKTLPTLEGKGYVVNLNPGRGKTAQWKVNGGDENPFAEN